MQNRKIETLFLFSGDTIILSASLWLALFLRYLEIPTIKLLQVHLTPFIILYFLWIFIFFIFGLYEKHTILFKNKLPSLIFNVQILNVLIATSFFYLLPFFTIAPKTNLFLWLIISSLFLLLWRLYIVPSIGVRKPQNTLIIAGLQEIKDLRNEINYNNRYGFRLVESIDINNLTENMGEVEVGELIKGQNITVIITDLKNQNINILLPDLYNMIYKNIQFIDLYKLYEDVFNREPLSSVNYNWIIENISTIPKVAYDILKRSMDIIASIGVGVIALILIPFVYIAVKIEDGGPLFSFQTRTGRCSMPFGLVKFRSMTGTDIGKDMLKSRLKVTRVGSFLRKTRLDEFPQAWNLIQGDISFIGPRPEFPAMVEQYTKEIPYYGIRHLIKPGLSGWAQIYHQQHPHHKIDINETKMKLSYDLYYIKNRSFTLDIKIALKTLKVILSKVGV